MPQAEIRRLCEQFLGGHVSEDYFWYTLVKYGILGGYHTTFKVAQALSLGLVPEGGDGA